MNDRENETERTFARPVTRRSAIFGGAAAIAGGAAMVRGLHDARAEQPPGGAGLEYRPRAKSADAQGKLYSEEHWDRPGEPGRDYTPVVTPNGWTLPFKIVDGIKVFHLVAEEVQHEFAP